MKTNIKKLQKKSWIDPKIFSKILASILQISETELFIINKIDKKLEKQVLENIEKYKNGYPLEYILKKAEFFSLDFFVNENVLIPRNETELLVEKVIHSQKIEQKILIDVGTGSGAIAISILKNSSIPKALAIDISQKALEVTKKNIKYHELEDKIQTLQSDLLLEIVKNNSLSSEERARVRSKKLIITANLPYVKNGDFENMSKETILYEPGIALYGWEKTGFELYEKLIEQIQIFQKEYKIPEITLFIEIWFDQKEIAKNFLEMQKKEYKIYKDTAGITRIFEVFFR